MKTNWKDFGLMFVVGIVLVVLIHSLFTVIDGKNLYELSILLLPYGIPMIFYFYRNKSELKEVAAVSFAFGFVANILFAFTFIILIFYHIIPDPYAAGGAFLFPEPIGLLILLMIPSLIFAVLSLIYGLIIWFVIDKLKWKKVLEKPKESKR